MFHSGGIVGLNFSLSQKKKKKDFYIDLEYVVYVLGDKHATMVVSLKSPSQKIFKFHTCVFLSSCLVLRLGMSSFTWIQKKQFMFHAKC